MYYMSIFQIAETHPERVFAITDTGMTFKYGDILNVEKLIRRSVGRNLAFLLCRNTPGTLLSYLGALKSDAVPLLLDASMPVELLKDLSICYKPSFFVIPADRQEEISQLIPSAEEIWRFQDSMLIWTGWDGPALAKELKLLLTTSGSTGSPKLVRISEQNLEANAGAIAEYLQIDGDERPITSLPMHYSYGISVINSHVLRGATLLLTARTVLERGFWEFAKHNEATSFAGVPYTYELLDRLRFYGLAPPSLRTLTQAGGKLQPELHEKIAGWCRDTGRRLFVMYGQTEASPRMGYLPAEVSVEKRGSMGIAIPGGKLYLIDEDGREVEAYGQAGELVYEGRNVSLGYAECREDLTLGDENCGVLKTGDMAYRDAEGYYYIIGRKKRFIKLLGQRVSLDDVERRLKAKFHFEAACLGEDGLLRVLIQNMTEEQRGSVESYLSDHMGIPIQLVRISGIDVIPKSAAGKVLYGKIM